MFDSKLDTLQGRTSTSVYFEKSEALHERNGKVIIVGPKHHKFPVLRLELGEQEKEGLHTVTPKGLDNQSPAQWAGESRHWQIVHPKR